MKYLNGKIYKLIDNTNGNIYIGSTCTSLKERLQGHKDNYLEHKKKVNNGSTSYNIIKNNDYKIELLENFPCKSKQELLNKEREYIENNKCINIVRPIITHQEMLDNDKKWRTNNKDKLKIYRQNDYKKHKDKILEKHKIYYESNKDKLAEQKKIYYEANKDKLAEKKKIYYEANKDKLAEQMKNYYEANKDKINKRNSEKIQCDICSSTISKNFLAQHKKTPKCQNYKKD